MHREETRAPDTVERGRFYRTTPWQRFRRWFLATTCADAGCSHATAHALCQDCHEHGRVEAATDVDHIVPRADGGADLDPRNCRGLCASCHSRRTMEARLRA